MMRHAQIVVRGLLTVAILATILLMVFYRLIAHLAAIPIPVLWFVLVLVGNFERRARASVLRNRGQTKSSEGEVEIDVESAGWVTALAVAGTLAIGSFLIAALLFGVESLAEKAFLFCFLAAFYVLPYLPLYIIEAGREEREKVTRSSLPNQGADADAQTKAEECLGSSKARSAAPGREESTRA